MLLGVFKASPSFLFLRGLIMGKGLIVILATQRHWNATDYHVLIPWEYSGRVAIKKLLRHLYCYVLGLLRPGF